MTARRTKIERQKHYGKGFIAKGELVLYADWVHFLSNAGLWVLRHGRRVRLDAARRTRFYVTEANARSALRRWLGADTLQPRRRR